MSVVVVRDVLDMTSDRVPCQECFRAQPYHSGGVPLFSAKARRSCLPMASSTDRRGLEDPADRAQSYRIPGEPRVPLAKLGFNPANRGGAGVLAWHCHEVGWDIASRKVKLSRYQHVAVVKVPPVKLEAIRQKNIKKASEEALLPPASRDITHVTLTKTHFVHACKLAAQGGRTVFNEGKAEIKFQAGDMEGQIIAAEGPVCVSYSPEILDDVEAMNAFMAEDNLNAGVQMRGTEMELYGSICAVVGAHMAAQSSTQLVPKPPSTSMVLQRVRKDGQTTLNEDDTKSLLALRLQLTESISEVFRLCQFHAFGNRVRVRAVDFLVVSRLETRAPWSKICTVLAQFSTTLSGRTSFGPETSAEITFVGREEVYAKRLSAFAFNALADNDVAWILAIESFIKKMLRQYAVGDDVGDHGKVLDARSVFFADCGKVIVKAATTLGEAKQKAASTSQPIAPEAMASLENLLTRQRPEIEHRFRSALTDARAFTNYTLPEVVFHRAPTSEGKTASGSKRKAGDAAGQNDADIAAAAFDRDGNVVLTPAQVFRRLRISGLGEAVLYRARADVTAEDTKVEAASGPGVNMKLEPDDQATKSSTPCGPDPGDVEVTLVSLQLPKAIVTKPGTNEEVVQLTVLADALLPCPEVETKKKKVAGDPALMEICADMLVEPFSLDNACTSFMRAVCEHSLQALFTMSIDGWKPLDNYRVSDKDKVPVLMQVHVGATKTDALLDVALKKRQILLFPYTSRIEEADAPALHNLLDSGHTIVHQCHEKKVKMVIRAFKKREKQPALVREFVLLSPLLAAKSPKARESVADCVPSYWCCGRAQSMRGSNMQLESMVFDVPYPTAVSPPKSIPVHWLRFTVELDVMVNEVKVTSGERLLLPFSDSRNRDD